MTTALENGVRQALAGCVVSMAQHTVGDSGYTNPDGAHVEASLGTGFVELELSPAAGSLIRVEVALPPSDRLLRGISSPLTCRPPTAAPDVPFSRLPLLPPRESLLFPLCAAFP